tara:strand:+ start:2097 stop:2309 length:213 start_codon:yes stop_codon:yes gene_type:complete
MNITEAQLRDFQLQRATMLQQIKEKDQTIVRLTQAKMLAEKKLEKLEKKLDERKEVIYDVDSFEGGSSYD